MIDKKEVAFRSRLQQFAHVPPSYALSPDSKTSTRRSDPFKSASRNTTLGATNQSLPTKGGDIHSLFIAKMTTPVKRESAQSEGFGDTDSPVRKGKEKSPLKRTATLDAESESGAATPNKKKRRSAKERSANDEYSPENKLVDSLRPGLLLVMVGLNPGLNTAQTG